jgi:hypothetical protein
MCELCSKALNQCPTCRKFFEVRPSVQLRRIIGNLAIDCQYCNSKTTRSELKSHEKNCPFKPDTCIVCSASILKSARIAHAVSLHPGAILAAYTGDFTIDVHEERKIKERDCINLSKRARLGKSGKYYCGKELNPSCECCGNLCGRISGCNCAECMKLDILARDLPKGYLVNNNGIICKKDKSNKVVCMCLFGSRRCGEDFQCESCSNMEKVWDRYASLLIN